MDLVDEEGIDLVFGLELPDHLEEVLTVERVGGKVEGAGVLHGKLLEQDGLAHTPRADDADEVSAPGPPDPLDRQALAPVAAPPVTGERVQLSQTRTR